VEGDANFTPWWTTPSQTTAYPAQCETGDSDGEFEDRNSGHRHHEKVHHACCETDGGSVEDDDLDSGKHFQSTSVDSGTFTSDTNSHTLTMVGTGIHDGVPVGFTMIAVDNGGLAPRVFTSRTRAVAARGCGAARRLNIQEALPAEACARMLARRVHSKVVGGLLDNIYE
jgi:hypothetical protein